MTQDIVGRVQRLLMSPKTEWDVIDGEAVEPKGLAMSYVAPLAAIPAVALFIGMGVLGMGPFKLGLGGALTMAITQFVMAVVFVFVFAFIIDALAPNFGANKNFNQALKVAAYTPTASWVAGVFMIIPLLGILALVGSIYSLYLLFVGLPKLMKPAADKGTTYTIVAIVVAIVAGIVINLAAQSFMPKPSFDDMLKKNSALSEMSKHADAMDKASQSGDVASMMDAASKMMNGDVPVVDADALKKLAPEKVAGLKRTSIDVQSLSMPFKMVEMTAKYGEGDKTVDLKITNSGMISAVSAMAGFGGAQYDRKSDDGYERMTKKDGAMVVETWSNASKMGHYGRMVGEEFLVQAEGRGVEMKQLQKIVDEFSEKKLKSLKRES